MEGCGSGCECSSGPPASPSRWGSPTLHPAPASPLPEVTRNVVRGHIRVSMSGMEPSTEPGTLVDHFTSYRKKDFIVVVFYLIICYNISAHFLTVSSKSAHAQYHDKYLSFLVLLFHCKHQLLCKYSEEKTVSICWSNISLLRCHQLDTNDFVSGEQRHNSFTHKLLHLAHSLYAHTHTQIYTWKYTR